MCIIAVLGERFMMKFEVLIAHPPVSVLVSRESYSYTERHVPEEFLMKVHGDEIPVGGKVVYNSDLGEFILKERGLAFRPVRSSKESFEVRRYPNNPDKPINATRLSSIGNDRNLPIASCDWSKLEKITLELPDEKKLVIKMIQ